MRVHWHHPVFFSCKEVGVFFTIISSLDGIKVDIFWRYKLVIKVINATVLNKLQPYSRISALGPEDHCTIAVSGERCVFYVDRMRTSTRGVWLMWTGEGVKNPIFVDIINGRPLMHLSYKVFCKLYQVLICQQMLWKWWLSGKFGALHQQGRRFEPHSSHHVGTLDKSFTRSCWYEMMWRPAWLPCG